MRTRWLDETVFWKCNLLSGFIGGGVYDYNQPLMAQQRVDIPVTGSRGITGTMSEIAATTRVYNLSADPELERRELELLLHKRTNQDAP